MPSSSSSPSTCKSSPRPFFLSLFCFLDCSTALEEDSKLDTTTTSPDSFQRQRQFRGSPAIIGLCPLVHLPRQMASAEKNPANLKSCRSLPCMWLNRLDYACKHNQHKMELDQSVQQRHANRGHSLIPREIAKFTHVCMYRALDPPTKLQRSHPNLLRVIDDGRTYDTRFLVALRACLSYYLGSVRREHASASPTLLRPKT